MGNGAREPEAVKRPKCLECRHYYVTYEPSFPHGCRLFQMRSRMLPSIEVERNSGRPCQGYEAKRPDEGRNR